ncbi:MAG: hypothetical protein J6T57_02995 [Alphaproteobacteria bacterium]|nr:hypothetical protein [Alphaproteobacteria bacterium]
MERTIIFISPDFDSETREKIVRSLGIHNAIITDNIKCATIVINPGKGRPSITMAALALLQMEQTGQDLNMLYFKLPDKLHIPPLPQVAKNKKHTIPMQQHALNRFTQTQNTYRQRIFNRTNHK